MKRLRSLEKLGIKYGKRLEDNFYLDLGHSKPRINALSPYIIAWGKYTGLLALNKAQQILINYNCNLDQKLPSIKIADMPIISSHKNSPKCTWVILDGYSKWRNEDYFCIKEEGIITTALGNLIKEVFIPGNNNRLIDANFIIVEIGRFQYFVLLID